MASASGPIYVAGLDDDASKKVLTSAGVGLDELEQDVGEGRGVGRGPAPGGLPAPSARGAADGAQGRCPGSGPAAEVSAKTYVAHHFFCHASKEVEPGLAMRCVAMRCVHQLLCHAGKEVAAKLA